MLNEYVYHGKERLRCGYTTGSCAAAAAKASAVMLISGKRIDAVSIMTPKGIMLSLDVLEQRFSEESASCAIKKDGGDDPDITNGVLVFARVEKTKHGIEIDGGEGVGRVTKNGLDQPVGAAAINSTPRKMIAGELSRIADEYGYDGGFSVVISIPDGKELAAKTFNPRMGIVGGISVIGTSGIVEPMSSKALVETIRVEEKLRRADGINTLLLTLGNYSEDFLAGQMPFALEKSVKCSNFIGEAIDAALEYGFSGTLIVGHIGKLVKLGAGIMNTHSSQADGRLDVLVTCGVIAGADTKTLQKIIDCVTVDDALGILDGNGCMRAVLDVLMKRAEYYLDAKVKKNMDIGCVMFSNTYGVLGMTEGADKLIGRISEEYNG